MQFGDKTSIDGDRLSALSDNNLYLRNALNSKPSGILMRRVIRLNTTSYPASDSGNIFSGQAFKVDKNRYIKVAVDIGHLNVTSIESVLFNINLSSASPAGGSIKFRNEWLRPQTTSGIVPQRIIFYDKIESDQISSVGYTYLEMNYTAATSFQIQRYIEITVEDQGEGYL